MTAASAAGWPRSAGGWRSTRCGPRGGRPSRPVDLEATGAGDPASTAPQEEERAARRLHLAGALCALGPRQREVLALRLVDGRSTAETAALLGIAEGTVKATVHQTLRALRAALQETTP